MLQDVTHALRTLLRAKAFTAVAVLTLALGIGANTVVYSIVDALLLRPLPFGDRGSRLVTLHSTHPTRAQDWDNSLLSYPDLVDVREQSRALEDLQGVVSRNFSMSSTSETERVIGASVTPGLFGMLRAAPERGRLFTEAEGAAPGFEHVVIISDQIWKRLYGGDPSIVGRAIMVNGRQLTVVGVMPPRFGFPEHADVWVPLRLGTDADRSARSVLAVGLLRNDVSLDQAREEIASIGRRLAHRFPGTNQDWGVFTMPMRDLFVGAATQRAVAAMLGAVVLVLLVGCANIASLLVARGVGRQRELTTRAALGASRWRLVRMLLIETAMLAIAGGALGLLFAAWGLDAFVASNPEPPPYWAQLSIDVRVAVYAFALALAAALLCGALPALKVTSLKGADGLLQTGRSMGATLAQRRFQAGLLVGQIAMSFALLAGAALLARSAMELRNADAGFDATPILSLRFYVAGDAYDDAVARARAVSRVVDEVAQLPGVVSVGATGAIPADDGGMGIDILPDGATMREGAVGAQAVPISGAVFGALGLKPVEGRTLTPAEDASPDAESAVINHRLAARVWNGESAVGRTLRVVMQGRVIPFRVSGVVPDVVYEELGEETSQSRLIVYVPYARLGWRTMALLIRSGGEVSAIAPAVRQAVRRADPAFAVYDVMNMTDRRAFTQWGERFLGRTFGAFAIAALLLACIGTYGLTAYAAAQRTKEIGLRIAIGATRMDVVSMLMRRGTLLAGIGLLAGLPLAVFVSRAVQGLLFRVSASDLRLWLLVLVGLIVPVLAANLIPAHRASECDPADALRHEAT